MLGLSGSLARGSATLKSIVKKNLQAWYKADRTQAPLGEEEIANGDFSLGAEVVINGDFNVSEAVTTSSNSLGWKQVGIEGGGVSITNGELVLIGSDGTGVEGDGDNYSRVYITDGVSSTNVMTDTKTYKLTYTVSSVSGSTDLEYHNGSGYSDATETVGTHIVYFTQDTGLDFILRNNGANGSIVKLSNVSVKQTDPGDNWGDTTDRTWTVEDGKLSHVQGTGDANQCRQTDVIKPGKKYQVSYSIVDHTSGSVRVDLGDDNAGTARSALGDYSEVITNTGTATFVDVEPVAGGPGTFKGAISNISVKEITNSVKDFSPNANNGVLYSGKALHFAQTGDYIDIDYWKSKTINANTKATFAVWFNCDDVSPGAMIFAAATGRFYLGAKGTKLELGWDAKGWQSYETQTGSAPTIVNQTWYRAVVVVDGLTCSVYLNGGLIFSKKTPNSSFTLDDNGVYIGSEGDIASNIWYGELADFQIYDKAWTASDVTYDYNNPDKDVFDDEGRAEVVSDIELVDNGTFDSAGSWNNLNIVDGKATKTSTSLAFQDEVVTVGKTYQVTVDVETVGAASQIYAGGNSSSNLVAGTQTVYIVAGPTNAYIGFNNGNSSTVYNSISVKEVTTQAGEISPTDCTALYRLNEGAGDRVYNAAPVLGANLIGNSDFSSGVSGWNDVGSGTIEHVTSFGGRSNVAKITTPTTHHIDNKAYHTFTATPNAIYEVKLDVYVVGGEFRVDGSNSDLTGSAGGGSDIIHQGVTSGWVTVSGIAFGESGADVSTQLWIRAKSATSDLECYVDNVSVKEARLSDSYVQESWVSGNWKTAQPYIPQYAMSSYSKKMVFDGSDDYVELATEKTIAAADPFSFSFWYYNIDESADQPILGRDGSTDDYLVLDGGHEGLIYKVDGTSRYLTFNSDLTTGKLNHVVLTSTGGEISGGLKCYVNGYLQTDTEPSLSSDFHYRDIMQSQGTFGEGFIDELAHFSTELSATEVSELFNAGMALDCRDHSAYLGGEIVADGGFDTDVAESTSGTHWITQAGWTIVSGSATYDGGGNSNTKLQTVSNSGFKDGKIHKLVFDLTDTDGGGVHAKICDGTFSDKITGTGTKTVYITAGTGTNRLEFETGHDDKAFAIDNVSVKEVQLNGYWRNNGIDTWTDLSLYGNDGTVNGSPTTIQLQEVPYFKKDTFGLPMNKVRQKGLNLDGDSYVEIADDNSINPTSAITVACWVYWNETLSNGARTHDIGIVSKWESGTEDYMLIKGTDKTFDFYIGTDFERSNDLGMDTPGWVYIAGTYDGSTIKTYKNGVSNSSGTSVSRTIPNTAQVLEIGRYRETVDRSYPERIDEVKIYNRALSAGELLRNYKATKSKHKDNTVSNWSDDFSDSFI